MRASSGEAARLEKQGWSFACLGRFPRRTKKKERLVVVYPYFEPYTELDAMPKPFFLSSKKPNKLNDVVLFPSFIEGSLIKT